MWTKKMKARVPKRLKREAMKNPYVVLPWMERLANKRRKTLAAMGYRLVSAEWLYLQPKGMWVERVFEPAHMASWVCRT